MKQITSSLDGVQDSFDNVRAQLRNYNFTLGGNWEYDHGYFDRSLDEAHKVWLRIPFQVVTGRLDGDSESTNAIVRMGTPFVLKHVYNEGLDTEANVGAYSGLINQFQAPLDPDADVEEKWAIEAADILRKVEEAYKQ
ncbi:YugN-like family protein [compost metagenome]